MPRRLLRLLRRLPPAPQLAYASALLLLAAGSAGSAGLWAEVTALLARYAPGLLGGALDAVRALLLALAALGGVTVLLGGLVAERRGPRLAAGFLIGLGAGLGLLGLAVQVAGLLLAGRAPSDAFSASFTGLGGLGALLAALAQLRLRVP